MLEVCLLLLVRLWDELVDGSEVDEKTTAELFVLLVSPRQGESGVSITSFPLRSWCRLREVVDFLLRREKADRWVLKCSGNSSSLEQKAERRRFLKSEGSRCPFSFSFCFCLSFLFTDLEL